LSVERYSPASRHHNSTTSIQHPNRALPSSLSVKTSLNLRPLNLCPAGPLNFSNLP